MDSSGKMPERGAGRAVILYRAARVVLILGALLWVFASISAYMLPELAYDEGPMPTQRQQQLDLARAIGVALLLAVPFRWTARGVPFFLRLIAVSLISLWILVAAARGLWGFVQGSKHWLVIPASGMFVVVAILLPLTLLTARKIYGRGEAGYPAAPSATRST